MSHDTQGVTVVHGGQNGALQELSLLNVDIQATIIDTAAHIVLLHVFENTLAEKSGRAKFILPVPAGAAVCAFQMETSDGKFIVGEVKEKSEAESIFALAIQRDQAAGIVNWAGDDVFTISIGSISGRTSVITKTTLVMNLMDDTSADEIRLVLPVSIGAQRYGLPLPEAQDATHPQGSTRLRFTATIQSSGFLRKISSPSHEARMSVQPYRNHRGIDSRHRAEVKMRSRSFLTSDLVLCAKADGLDAPRCFGEHDPSGGTVALQLSLAPNFEITQPPSQEFLFLVDCSGSMGPEGRIETAKQALSILLRTLPNQGDFFNIFCFGSTCVSLWMSSRPYTEVNLNEAIAYVHSIDAELGGTEINAAMRVVLASKNASIPTIVYALTDGEVHQEEINATCQTLRSAVNSSNAQRAPVRAFTLGIGQTVSTALCEGIARIGQGVALFAVDAREIIPKCARLVGAGIHPTISDIVVDWGPIPASASNSADTVIGTTLQPPLAIQQTPQELTTLYRNHRFVVYAILQTPHMPRQVILRGRVQNGTSDHIEIAVPVRTAKRFSSAAHMNTSSAFMHTLAARGLIRDLRDGTLAPRPVTTSTPPYVARRAEIVRLGVRYQLVSEHTSFIGVDEGETVQKMERVWRERKRQHTASRRAQSSAGTSSWSGMAGAAFDWVTGAFQWILSSGTSSSRSRMPGGYATRTASPDSRSHSSGARSGSTQRDDPSDVDSDIDDRTDGYSTERSLSSISSLESHTTINTAPRRRRSSRRTTRQIRNRSRERSPELRTTRTERAAPTPRPQPQADDLSLLTMQAFDGSFSPSAELVRIIGRDASVEAAALGVPPVVWATARVLAYLEGKLHDQPDLLDVVRDKVMEYGAKAVGELEFQRLLAEARASR